MEIDKIPEEWIESSWWTNKQLEDLAKKNYRNDFMKQKFPKWFIHDTAQQLNAMEKVPTPDNKVLGSVSDFLRYVVAYYRAADSFASDLIEEQIKGV